ncbi:FecR family protein [Winogradskyella wandonensis]|nr:FecR domain-containing protein [Winogradskyella wandonensis]
MEREELIKKWLDYNLNPEEQKAFEQLDDYDELIKLSKSSEGFVAPVFNVDDTYKTVASQLKTKKPINWITPLLKIAAVFLIAFGVAYYTYSLDTANYTSIAEQQEIILPDASTVKLNAVSNLVFNKNKWSDNREVLLEGEAFFKVAKGSKFDVLTKQGKVSVLGTEFNVIQRDNYFEVTCYEGLVAVNYKSKYFELKPGKRFTVLNEKINNTSVNKLQPSWITDESSFESLPLQFVLDEFERQYNIKVTAASIDTEQLFTGSFSHTDLDLALKSITLPLGITYTKTDNVIVLTRE